MSTVGTPDSSSTSNSIQQSRFPIQQPQFGINTAVPDLTAMMFPSADPFAYPNQPMAAFDNLKQENVGLMNNSQIPLFLSNGTPTPTSGRYDDLEGQLFGPLPPYLSQGQQNYDFNSHLGTGSGMMHGLPGQDLTYHTGVTPNNDMAGNFDGFFSGDGDDWSNGLTDQRFG